MKSGKHRFSNLAGWILALGLILGLLTAGALAEDALPGMNYDFLDRTVERGDLLTVDILPTDGVDSFLVKLTAAEDEGWYVAAFDGVMPSAGNTFTVELPTAADSWAGKFTLWVQGYSNENGLVAESTEDITIEDTSEGKNYFFAISQKGNNSTFAYQEGFAVSFYFPGAVNTSFVCSDGDDYYVGTDSFSGILQFAKDGTYTFYAEALYEDGHTEKTQVYTVTQSTPNGAITGITADVPAFLPAGEDLTITISKPDDLSADLNWSVNLFNISEDWAYVGSWAADMGVNSLTIPHKETVTDPETEEEKEREIFSSGCRYSLFFMFYDASNRYIPQTMRCAVQVGEVDPEHRVTLKIDDQSDAVNVQLQEAFGVDISAEDATAVSIVFGDEDILLNEWGQWNEEGGWAEHPEEIFFTWVWTKGEQFVSCPVVSWACFDEDPFAEGAVWVMSNVVTITTQPADGVTPAVEADNPDASVERGSFARFPLTNLPEEEGYNGCFLSVEGVNGTEGYLDDTCWDSVVIIPTGNLPAGLYRVNLQYRITGMKSQSSYYYLQVTDPEDGVVFNVDKDEACTWENIQVTGYVPGAIAIRLRLVDDEWNDYGYWDGESFQGDYSSDRRGEKVLYLEAKWNEDSDDWERVGETRAVNISSTDMDSPAVIEGDSIAQAGQDYPFTVSWDPAATYVDINVWDKTEDWNEVFVEHLDPEENKTSESFTLKSDWLQEGHVYNIRIYTMAYGYEPSEAELDLVVTGTISEELTLRLENELPENNTLPAHTDLIWRISAPKNSTIVDFYDGNDWQRVYDTRWGWEDADLSALSREDGWDSGEYTVFLRAASEEPDEEESNLTWIYSDVFHLTLTAEDQVKLPEILLDKTEVTRGETLTLTISEVDHAEHYDIDIVRMDDFESAYGYSCGPQVGTVSLMTAGLAPGEYFISLWIKPEAGWDSTGTDWGDQESLCRFTVTEGSGEALLIFDPTEAKTQEVFRYAAWAPGADRVRIMVLQEGETDSDWFVNSDGFGEEGDTITGSWSQDRSGEYILVLQGWNEAEDIWQNFKEITLKITSEGALETPIIELESSPVPGQDLNFSLTLDEKTEYAEVRVNRLSDWDELIVWRDISSGSFTIPGDLLEDGKGYEIRVYSAATGREPGDASLRFTVMKPDKIQISLSINDETETLEVLANEEVTLKISAPGATVLEIVENGDGYERFWQEDWDQEVDPADMTYTRGFGGDGQRPVYIRATTTPIDEIDWDNVNWDLYSNTVVLKIVHLGDLSQPQVTLDLPESRELGRDESLNLSITMPEEEPVNSFHVSIRGGNREEGNDDYYEEYFFEIYESPDIRIPLAALEPGLYRVEVNVQPAQAGWNWSSTDDEDANLFFAVIDSGKTAILSVDKDEAVTCEDFVFSLYVKDADAIGLRVDEWIDPEDPSTGFFCSNENGFEESAKTINGSFDTAGIYTLRLMSRQGDGVWVDTGESVTVKVTSEGEVSAHIGWGHKPILGRDLEFWVALPPFFNYANVEVFRQSDGELLFHEDWGNDQGNEKAFTINADFFEAEETYYISVYCSAYGMDPGVSTLEFQMISGLTVEAPEEVWTGETFGVSVFVATPSTVTVEATPDSESKPIVREADVEEEYEFKDENGFFFWESEETTIHITVTAVPKDGGDPETQTLDIPLSIEGKLDLTPLGDVATSLLKGEALTLNLGEVEHTNNDNYHIQIEKDGVVLVENETVDHPGEWTSPAFTEAGLWSVSVMAFGEPGYAPSTAKFKVLVIEKPTAATTLELPDGTMTIEANAFEGIGAQYVIIPDSCTSIGIRAFADCESLAFISILGSETSIDDDAFEGSDYVTIINYRLQ